jgi:hypothetical protein
MPTPPLLFVYNADSGVLNALKDLWIKTVTPERYDCQLCAVTYGLTGMKREWREFVKHLGTPVEFLHRDELVARYGPTDVTLPAAFIVGGGQPQLWLSADQLVACRTLADLMTLVRRELPALEGRLHSPAP